MYSHWPGQRPTRTGTGNKWVVWNCVDAFTLYLNHDRGQDLLSPSVLVSLLVPLSANTPLHQKQCKVCYTFSVVSFHRFLFCSLLLVLDHLVDVGKFYIPDMLVEACSNIFCYFSTCNSTTVVHHKVNVETPVSLGKQSSWHCDPWPLIMYRLFSRQWIWCQGQTVVPVRDM